MSTLAAPTRTWPVATLAATVAQAGSVSDTNKDVCVALVAQMVTRGLATVLQSCNGSTVGTTDDGVNRWAARADIVRNTPGNAHSWTKLLLTGGLGQLVIDMDNTLDGSGSVYWSESAGFTGGTTTARPTATDEDQIRSAGGNILHTVNGTNRILMWRCSDAGRECVRWAILNSGATAGPCHVTIIDKAASTPAAWTTKIVARTMSGSGVFGNRSDFTSVGFRARVSGTLRTPLAVGDTPPSTLDVDGDALIVPCGLNDATIGRLGFLDDFHFAADAVAKEGTYSDENGTMGWVRIDELVMPWDHATAMGSNTAGAKLLVNYLPAANAVPPVITMITTPGVLPGTLAQAKQAPIVFEVTDIDPGLLTVPIYIRFAGVAGESVLVRRGVFRAPFSGSITAITDGFRFSVNPPSGGWPGTVTIILDPIDGDGNMVAA